MKKPKITLQEIILAISIVIWVLLIGLVVYALIEYGDTPVKDVPLWAYWLMGRR
jgi:hypothetical protein